MQTYEHFYRVDLLQFAPNYLSIGLAANTSSLHKIYLQYSKFLNAEIIQNASFFWQMFTNYLKRPHADGHLHEAFFG